MFAVETIATAIFIIGILAACDERGPKTESSAAYEAVKPYAIGLVLATMIMTFMSSTGVCMNPAIGEGPVLYFNSVVTHLSGTMEVTYVICKILRYF